MRSSKKLLLLTSVTLLATGCASINPQEGFDQVAMNVDKRIGNRVHWYTGSEEDAQVRHSIQQQLEQPLTVESAVQIALLNNQTLQSNYADLGISQADLVQAGLLKNPVLELTRLKPRESGEPDDALDVELRFEFLDILLIPLKKKAAEQNYASVKQRVTGQVLDHAARVRKAFYNVQAAQHTQNMAEEVLLSAVAALETASRLHKIGNINDGSFNRFQLARDEANLAVEEAKIAARSNRETVNKLLGLYGKQTQWRIEGGLKPIPFEAINVDDIEQRVLGNSLDLAMLRHDMQALGEKGMYDMAFMQMDMPKNSQPMAGVQLQYGKGTMGGLFTIFKVREELSSYDDPGWYKHPKGTVARLAKNTELKKDGMKA